MIVLKHLHTVKRSTECCRQTEHVIAIELKVNTINQLGKCINNRKQCIAKCGVFEIHKDSQCRNSCQHFGNDDVL